MNQTRFIIRRVFANVATMYIILVNDNHSFRYVFNFHRSSKTRFYNLVHYHGYVIYLIEVLVVDRNAIARSWWTELYYNA